MSPDVAAAAIVRNGRVLAARRTEPVALAGGWELPGGKVEPGETVAEAAVREVREELGCDIEVGTSLPGRQPLSAGYQLTVHLARVRGGEPVPGEHDMLRWLGPEELDEVAWLSGDLPFLSPLREVLLDGEELAGGNVGGGVRVGPTVRRTTGAWTPAVHRLLRHLGDSGFADVPQVLGVDERGREVLTYLPGRVVDVDTEAASESALASAMRWLRRCHDSVDGVDLGGPWRTATRQRRPGPGELICHNDFAPYNVALSASPSGEQVVGVFDWDMAGPGTRLEELAFAAWNWIPLHRPSRPGWAARRLGLMAEAYGRDVAAADIAAGVVPKIEQVAHAIAAGQAAGDPGMLSLADVGEPDRMLRILVELRERMPAVVAALAAEGSDL